MLPGLALSEYFLVLLCCQVFFKINIHESAASGPFELASLIYLLNFWHKYLNSHKFIHKAISGALIDPSHLLSSFIRHFEQFIAQEARIFQIDSLTEGQPDHLLLI